MAAPRAGGAPRCQRFFAGLSRRGFVIPEPHKRPKGRFVRFQADQPNERWQLDIAHWRFAVGGVEFLNQVDDHYRLAVASDARVTFKAADVVARLRRAAATSASRPR